MAGPWERFQKAPDASDATSAAGPWTRFAPQKPVAAAGADFVAPEPPPGAVIHGGDGRSYVADHPEIGVVRTAQSGTRDEAIQQQALRGRAATDGTVGDIARAARPFAQGQSLNFADELVSTIFGGAEALRGGSAADGFDYGQEFQKQELDRRRQEAPITSAATEMAGGFLTGAAGAPKVFASGAGLGANMLRGAAAGSASGAAAGFGGGAGMDKRIEDAIMGGSIGAGVGTAIPVAGAAVGAGVRAFGARNAAREILEPVGIGRRAADQIERELTRDGMTAADARARTSAMGPDAMLLDAGQNVGEGAEAVANLPGAGNGTVRGRLADRNRAAPDRIRAAGDTALGPQQNIAETVDELIARRSAASAPAYAAALERPIDWNDRLQAFIDDPVIRKGLREGVDIQRLEALARNEPFDPLSFAMTGVDEAGDPIISGVPNMRTLNVAKKGLDNILEGYRDPTSGRLNLDERGRAITEVQRAFLGELDNANPDYAAARAAWAGPTRVRNALGLGQDVFDRSVRPDQLRQRLAAMSDDERDAFRMGARDQLDEVMGTARRDAAAARGMFETGWNREKLGLVLGDDERATQFLDTLGNETAFANRSNSIAGGSASARRLERAGEYNGARSAARNALDPSSGAWGDVKRMAARGVDAVLDGRNARSAEEMRSEFGEAVSRQGGPRDELIDAIMGYGERKAASADRAIPREELMRAILSGGGLAIAN
jgi:hypothetical protein